MTAPATVTYGLDTDASLVARAADRALEGCGCHVAVEDGEVWIRRRNKAAGTAVRFDPGQMLVVESSGTWRIESAPECAT